jgi:hypothetical protein
MMKLDGDSAFLELDRSELGSPESPADEDVLLNVTVQVGSYSAADQCWIAANDLEIYYQIDNFDEVSESRSDKALQAEQGLVQMCGPRSTYSVDWFDRVQPGSKLHVRYQCFSDGQIEIVGVEPAAANAASVEIQQALQRTRHERASLASCVASRSSAALAVKEISCCHMMTRAGKS